MDISWENKNKNLIDKYNIRNIYLSKQADYIVTLCGCFREATHEGFGICSVLNACNKPLKLKIFGLEAVKQNHKLYIIILY